MENNFETLVLSNRLIHGDGNGAEAWKRLPGGENVTWDRDSG